MTDLARSLVQLAARRLERCEREAVLGDLAETGESAWRGLTEILGLVIRRRIALWNDWRPWIAAFAVALPSALLLMGVSFSISCNFQQEDCLLLLCHVLLLIMWSWTVGFVVGSVSRRTLWVSGALALIPCAYCLTMFREPSLSRLCLLLFVPPAILGARHGLRITRIKPRPAVALAMAVTVLMLCAWRSQALSILNWALLGPAWYIALHAWRPGWRYEKHCE
jgi:hypothetical protein